MNGQLQDLYSPLVLEHGRRPRNRRIPAGATHRASGDNPLCGDQIDIHLRIADGCVQDIGFDGVCCLFATASASLMTGAVMGQDLDRTHELHEAFLRLMAGADPASLPQLGGLVTLSSMNLSRERALCATLAWQALGAALRVAASVAAPGHANTHRPGATVLPPTPAGAASPVVPFT